jgi:hypothetical protein
MDLFARLKPLDPRRGQSLQRLHVGKVLYLGGDRPAWYKVGKALAAELSKRTQANGAPAFDIVTAADRKRIDEEEERRRLVALGLVSATVAAPATREAVDLTRTEKSSPGAREAAIPASAREDEIPLEPPARAGDLTTADLPENTSRRRRAAR